MSNDTTRKGILISFLKPITSLAQHGLAGSTILVGAMIVGAIAMITIASPWISPHGPADINVGPILSPPSIQFPLGTNHLGQDMLSRVYSGGAIMFQVALLSVIVCLAVGVPIGLFASYVGGYTDRLASLVMDSIYAFPGLVLAIAIAATLGPGVVNIAFSIAVVYVPSYFRIIRSQVLTIKELPYVEAAHMMGAKQWSTLFSYILPNVIPSIVTIATLNLADAVLTEAGLTFVGLGLSVSTPDWGWDLTYGRQLLPSGAWWVIAFPGLMIILLAMGFTLMGEGLSELFNPRLQK
ncbi:MAG: ABC transporter permease [Candidatus Bathyarchaeia archaeon]